MRSVKIKLQIMWLLLTNRYITNMNRGIWRLCDGETAISNIITGAIGQYPVVVKFTEFRENSEEENYNDRSAKI